MRWHEDRQRTDFLPEFDPSDLVISKNRNGEWALPETIRVIPGGFNVSSARTDDAAIEK
jgi:hypothetical protein